MKRDFSAYLQSTINFLVAEINKMNF